MEKKSKSKKAAQPLRFVPQRIMNPIENFVPGQEKHTQSSDTYSQSKIQKHRQMCLELSSSAQSILNQSICMHWGAGRDILAYTELVLPPIDEDQQRIGHLIATRIGRPVVLLGIERKNETARVYYVTSDFAKEILSPSSTYCSKQDYRAIQLGTPGHVSIALWIPKAKKVEVFDPSGKHEDTKEQKLLLELVLPKETKIHFVNDVYLQQEDEYCQTWIYYYIYKRVLEEELPRTIVRRLQKMTPKERFAEIQQFWTFLLYHT